MTVRMLTGDCRDVLCTLPDESVHCCISSPPYWGLRSYITDGDPLKPLELGLEPSLGEHVQVMTEVFREVRRVLRRDGTAWINYGDAYASSVNGRKAADIVDDDRTFRDKPFSTVGNGLKPKDLCGVPWRIAFALQADGWYLRQDIIWSKPNPMPESVRDRCTKAHEYIFLLSKSERYYFDQNAISEPLTGIPHAPGNIKLDVSRNDHDQMGKVWGANGLRNKRSVWEIATAPFSEAHFATFPPALITPCIEAGCPKQCCAKCGAPWVRKVLPSCSCKAGTVPGTVLDPFGGAGTTGLVADRLGRNAILIELNESYALMAAERIKRDAGMFAQVAAE